MNTLTSPIRMVDLVSQYQKIKSEVDSAVIGIMERATFINGAEVQSFQQHLESYLGVKHVIPCANGTDALQISMMALGLKPGDEVILPCFTYVATAEVIALLGLKPVLVDVHSDTFNIDFEQIEAAITSKTKAIVPVHLFGQCSDMDPIIELANKHQLYIIEDTAQAIGSTYTHRNGKISKAGTIGHMGATSFFPSKNLGCFGDGGAIFTNDDQLASKARMICNHGQSRLYYHDEIGVNSRLDTIQAAILDIKLKYLDEYNHHRNQAADYYNRSFQDIEQIRTPVVNSNSSHVYHQYTLKLNGIDRDSLKQYLASKEIPAMIYYPVPLNQQKAYEDKTKSFPVTESLCKSVISLPMHSELAEDQLEYITYHFKEFIKNNI